MAGAIVSYHYFGRNILMRYSSNYSVTLQVNTSHIKSGEHITLGKVPLVSENTYMLTRKQYEYIKNILPSELYEHKTFTDSYVHHYYHKYKPNTYRRVLRYIKTIKKEGK